MGHQLPIVLTSERPLLLFLLLKIGGQGRN